ncbi:MAG: hypothetical protein QXL16_01310 [Candidatus Micrarchaeaceae archaeon]
MAARAHLLLQDIIYASTYSLRKIAYLEGIRTGLSLKEERVSSFLDYLEKSGIGKVKYAPLISGALIKTEEQGSVGDLGKLHYFVSGIITGYFSYRFSSSLFAKEEECVMDGNSRCLFSISNVAPTFPKDTWSIEKIKKAFSLSKHEDCEEHFIESFIPISKGRIGEHAIKLIYGIWKEQNFGIEELCRALDIRMKKKKNEVMLEYSEKNSYADFVGFSSTLIAYMLPGRKAEIERRIKEYKHLAKIKI